MKWFIRKRYGNGIASTRKSYGYDVVDKQLAIVPNQARIMLVIGQQYLDGYSLNRILEEVVRLEDQGGRKWSKASIQKIFSDEKKPGDLLLQKTYVADCLTKKNARNTGQLPKYYVQNNHPAIFPREMWNAIQAERTRRNNLRTPLESKTNAGKFSSKHALTGVLICGKCGTPYRRVVWAKNGMKRPVWRCINRLESGPKACHTSPTIDEEMLHESIVKAIKQRMNQICNTVLDEDREQKKVERVEERIESKMEEMMNLVKLGARDK